MAGTPKAWPRRTGRFCTSAMTPAPAANPATVAATKPALPEQPEVQHRPGRPQLDEDERRDEHARRATKSTSTTGRPQPEPALDQAGQERADRAGEGQRTRQVEAAAAHRGSTPRRDGGATRARASAATAMSP